MRHLLLIACIVLAGCAEEPQTPKEPRVFKFNIGQKVDMLGIKASIIDRDSYDGQYYVEHLDNYGEVERSWVNEGSLETIQ